MDQPGDRPTQQLDDDPFTDGRLARAALDAIPVAMWLKDLEGRYLACNRRFEQLLGVEAADLVGRPSSDFVDAETAEVFRRQDRLALSIGKPVTHEQWVVDRLDDRRKLWETTKSTVRDIDGTAIGVLGISFDVTDRDEMYRQLVDETQRFEAAERLANTGSWDEDVVAGTSRWTRGVFDIFGLDPATTLPDRQVIIDLVHPDDREAVVRVTEEGRRHGQPYAQRYRAIVDGRLKHVESRGYPRLGVDGRLLRVTGTIQDVTDRTVAAQQLTDLIDGTKDAFALCDMDAVILEVNNVYCEINGFTPDELVGHRIVEFDAIQESTDYERLARVVESGGEIFETEQLRKDGTTWPVEVSLSYSAGGDGRLLVFMRDLTERRAAEAVIQAGAARHEALMELTMDGFAVLDTAGTILEINDVYCELSGYSREELVGRPIVDLRAPELSDGSATIVDEVRAAVAKRFDSVHVRKNGSHWPIQVSTVYSPIEGGRFFSYMRDLTDESQRRAVVQRAADDWATLLRGSTDGFLRVDREGRVVEASEPFCRLSGLQPDEVVGRSMADLNPYVDTHELVAGMDAFAGAGGGVVPGVVRHADGTDIPVEVSVMFTERDGGQFFTFIRDERERLRLNAEVEQSARRFRALLDASSDGVIIIGHDNRLTDVNARYLQLSGFARDDVLGMSIADLDARFDEHQLGAFRARTAELGTVIAESVHRRKDGSLWPVEVTATATGDETEEFFCFVRDITDRLQATAAVEQAAHRYQTLVDNTRDGFARATLDGIIFEANERLTEMFGMEPGALIGRSVTELNATRAPEATRAILASLPERGHMEIETEARRADGSTFPIRIELMHSAVDGGHLFAFLRDLSRTGQ